jgi:hypothetical protein
MKSNNAKKPKLQLLFLAFFLIITQLSFSQKKNQTTIINKENKVLTKINNPNCDCDKIDFKVRIIKLSATNGKRTYKLQLIDFENKNKCEIKFFNLNWKGQQMVLFSSMRNQNLEVASDGSFSLYEFEFDTKVNAIEPEDESPISTSILVKIGDKTCFIRDKQSTYLSQM